MPFRDVADAIERGYVAVHAEDAVGHDQTAPCRSGVGELGVEAVEVDMLVDEPACLAGAHAVDDGRVVQAIGDDRVPLVQKGREHAQVGVEAGAEEHRVVGPEEVRDLRSASLWTF